MTTRNIARLWATAALFLGTACAFEATDEQNPEDGTSTDEPVVQESLVGTGEPAMHYRMTPVLQESPTARPTPDPWKPPSSSDQTARPTPDPWQPDDPMDPEEEEEEPSMGSESEGAEPAD